MKSGDLVELTDQLLIEGDDYPIVVGDLKSGEGCRRFDSGTLAILHGDYMASLDEPASVILIDGRLGWVWNKEIRPASTGSGGDHATR